MTRWMSRVLLLAVVVAACVAFGSALQTRSRHPTLDVLTSSDASLSSKSKLQHSTRFMHALGGYADHLADSAELMLRQAESVEQHAWTALDREEQLEASTAFLQGEERIAGQTDVESGADGESEAESEAEAEVEAEFAGAADVDTLAARHSSSDTQLDTAFASGDAMRVASLLEARAGVHLLASVKADLAARVKATMRMVEAAVANHEPVDGATLRATLDSLVVSVLDTANKQLNDASSPLRKHLQEAAAAWQAQNGVPGTPVEEAMNNQMSPLRRYLDRVTAEWGAKARGEPAPAPYQGIASDPKFRDDGKPLEESMQEILKGAVENMDNPDSSIRTALRTAAKNAALKHDPELQQAPEWMQTILAKSITTLDQPGSELGAHLTEVATKEAAVATALEGAQKPFDMEELVANVAPVQEDGSVKIDEAELEGRVRYQARKAVFEETVEANRAACARKMARGEKCSKSSFLKAVDQGLDSIMDNKLPDKLVDTRDAPLSASPALDITRGPHTTPESVRDVEQSIMGGVDPWFDLPGRSKKELYIKVKTVGELLDGDGDRCPKRCSAHGQCVMDMARIVRSASGASNVHPFHCICDKGYVGAACQIKLDMHLRWLLTEGAAPFPKCCPVCQKQREVPTKWDDIPTYNNPFSAFSPQCQPWPRISAYSREDGGHELIKGRRPHPSCSAPLGEITHADPVVAIELAASLSEAQGILNGGLLETMDALSAEPTALLELSAEAAVAHASRLRAASSTLREASLTAKKAAEALAAKLKVPASALKDLKYSAVDLDQLVRDYREMPNDMEECCLFCQLDKEEPPMTSSEDPAAQVGPDAILQQDPRKDNTLQALHRRMAAKRKERRHAKLVGEVPKSEQDCCVVCPYNFREIERLEEAAHIRSHGTTLQRRSAEDSEEAENKAEMNKVFLETFAAVDRDRRRRHEPMPCCPACPSQFLIAHAFPRGPYTMHRTLPNTGPQ